MRRMGAAVLTGILPLFLGVVLVAGCSKNAIAPERKPPQPPNTDLTYAPVENDTVSFRVHFYWSGYDADGEVVAFYWIVDPDSADLHDPNHANWTRTSAKDTTLLFLVDPVQEVKGHEFVVAALDNSGLVDRTPAMRYFSAKTIPPRSQIDKGPAATNPIVGPNFTFEWSGIDPDGGDTGGNAPVDSFEYLLLRLGQKADTTGSPQYETLHAWDQAEYMTMINQATGPTLLPPHDDWKWHGIRALKKRFRNQTPGEYVFALRAVDVAGATEKNLEWVRNVRHFTVSDKNPGPSLTVTASVLTTPLPSATGPQDFVRKPLQLFEGETVSFSWHGDASAYGGDIAGYSFALDDTSSLGGGTSILTTGTTLGPRELFPGTHFLYVRCIDDGGLITNALIPLLIVHPAFKDPGAAREILWVDDTLNPGNSPNRFNSFPSDAEEYAWFTLQTTGQPLGEARFPRITAAFPGVTVTEWDTWQKSDITGRKQPEPKDLQDISTVVWCADYTNTPSTPIALWKTLVGGSYSELAGYLRAGGTLVLSGYNLIADATDQGRGANLLNNSRGLCYWAPGDIRYQISFFPRLFMDVNSAVPSSDGLRSQGANDFVAAYPTAAGIGAGFDTCYVDTGVASTGAKWNTNSDLTNPLFMNSLLTPGLFAIEGWNMMPGYQDAATGSYGCQDVRTFQRESQGVPIAQPIYTYHGVNVGVARDQGASPREGRVCGLLCQSHDLGLSNGGTYNPASAIGRCVILGFPFYFIKDQEASDVMFNAYSYVQASPTLP